MTSWIVELKVQMDKFRVNARFSVSTQANYIFTKLWYFCGFTKIFFLINFKIFKLCELLIY